jgi:hypothetical protein
VHQSPGIQKKTKRRQMSSKARKRHEKGIEMAEAVTERTGEKIKRSIGRERNVKERAKAWDAVNKAAEAEAAEAKQIEGDEEDEEDEDKKSGWETDEEVADAAPEAKTATQPATDIDDDGDEIL